MLKTITQHILLTRTLSDQVSAYYTQYASTERVTPAGVVLQLVAHEFQLTFPPKLAAFPTCASCSSTWVRVSWFSCHVSFQIIHQPCIAQLPCNTPTSPIVATLSQFHQIYIYICSESHSLSRFLFLFRFLFFFLFWGKYEFF